ncbi:MAG: glycoside hydrolase family 3 protein [Spirochaetaceae bacterium]|jgi:beta-N-acetylhexosaminidase|nr:glycoside hydrolase family 3 protein [Spirochaetaceae bacterium]
MQKIAARVFCLLSLFLACGILPAQSRRSRPPENPSDPEYRRRTEYLQQAALLAASMSRKTLCAQVLLTGVDGREAVSERTRRLLSDVPAGGIALFAYNISSDPEKTRVLIEELSRCISGVSLPPFIAADQEGGAVQRIRGKAALPPPLSYWEKFSTMPETAVAAIFAAVEQEAAGAGRELRRIGITLNLAPVAEVLTAGNQPFLKNRSYGPDAVFAVSAAAAFIRGMESAGVASSLKHFPGNSAADPHRNKTVLNMSGAELETLTAPFGELIHGEAPAAVMVSHVIVPAWDSKPCSLSPAAVRRLREMGFTGIIIADDFTMAAAGSPPEICAVEALAAGVDMIITWPGSLQKFHQAILSAIEAGKLSEKQIREAAERIIYQKLRYGVILDLFKNPVAS